MSSGPSEVSPVAVSGGQPNLALICHSDDSLSQELLLPWLSSFARVTGVVLIKERRNAKWRRLRAEYRRVGLLRVLDVLAFRAYYRLLLAADDAEWCRAEIARMSASYLRHLSGQPRLLRTETPNTPEVAQFLASCKPEVVVARCKWLLHPEIYDVARRGTFVFHPGICPEYRNSHGCFWALARRDLRNVGLTVLRIDPGIDTGPVYGYFHYDFDEINESHIRIQLRLVTENLDKIARLLLEICSGRAIPIDVRGRPSRVWGQPWLTAYLRWKRAAERDRQ